MKYLKTIIIASLLMPSMASAAISVGWNATSTDRGQIQPNMVNGYNPSLNIQSVATSTFLGGVDAARFCVTGTTICLTSSTGNLQNYWTLSGSNLFPNSGSLVQSPQFQATSSIASIFPYASTTASSGIYGYFNFASTTALSATSAFLSYASTTAITATNAFLTYASTTASSGINSYFNYASSTALTISGTGYFGTVGVGSTTPSSLFNLAVQGNSIVSGTTTTANLVATGTIALNGTTGTSGQVLTSNGSGAASWTTPSSGSTPVGAYASSTPANGIVGYAVKVTIPASKTIMVWGTGFRTGGSLVGLQLDYRWVTDLSTTTLMAISSTAAGGPSLFGVFTSTSTSNSAYIMIQDQNGGSSLTGGAEIMWQYF